MNTVTKRVVTGKPEVLLAHVTEACDVLVECASHYDGLLPSLLDRETGLMLEQVPPHIPGQREGDRAFYGCNLMHDHTTLNTMYLLAKQGYGEGYAEAADRYLTKFAVDCTNTVTGLFPWGEHSFWHFETQSPADSQHRSNPKKRFSPTHDHLHQAPEWLWDKLWSIKPDCVQKFCTGLDRHWTENRAEPKEYIRHAPIMEDGYGERWTRSCDFPRHSGFFIFDLAFAYGRTGREDFRLQLTEFLDYWWEKRGPHDLLLSESRTEGEGHEKHRNYSFSQALSLAASLLEAELLVRGRDEALADAMRSRGTAYVKPFASAPHNLNESGLVVGYNPSGEIPIYDNTLWGSRYGMNAPLAGIALTCLCIYRLTHHARMLDIAVAVGYSYARNQKLPEDVNTPSKDVGMVLELLADLYDVTGDGHWLETALSQANSAVPLFFDRALPRAASKADWYESQLLPG